MTKSASKELWGERSEERDFPAAEAFLSLQLLPSEVTELLRRLKPAPISKGRAGDVLRAAGLPLLAANDPEVARELKKVRHGGLLSPVLLIRGFLPDGVPLTIADGYPRVCASCHLDPEAEIRLRIVEPTLA